MATTYVAVTQAEVEELLLPQGFRLVQPDARTRELVYGRRVANDDGLQLCMRVYTGIEPDGHSRSVGTDAMRVTLHWRSADGQQVAQLAGSKRVHRVAGWRANLQQRIDGLQVGPRCTKVHDGRVCGTPMIRRTGTSKRTKRPYDFYSCADRACGGTANVAGAVA